MIRRVLKNLTVREADDAPDASRQLEADGWVLVHGVLTPAEIDQLVTEIGAVFDATGPERSRTDKDEFRYEMVNRSAACQAVVGHPRILELIEPLLGDDCHLIANT